MNIYDFFNSPDVAEYCQSIGKESGLYDPSINRQGQTGGQTVKIMIDTNIIIDVYQNRMLFADNSMKVLKLSESRKVAGCIYPVK